MTDPSCLCALHRERIRAVLNCNKESGFIRVIRPLPLPVRLGCYYEEDQCAMAIKLKGQFSNDVKSIDWFNCEDVALATGKLLFECFDSQILASFAKTRKGDLCVSLVQGKGESEKFYFSDVDTYLDWVLEVAGGDGEEEINTSAPAVPKPPKPTRTKG